MPDSFVFYISWLDNIKAEYPDDIDTQNKLIRRIVDYGLFGAEDFSTERMFMRDVYKQIDIAQEKHNKRVEAGRKGGQSGKGVSRNQGNSNAKTKANNSKSIANVNVNENVNVNDNFHFLNVNECAVGSRLNAEPPPRRLKEIIDEETGEAIYVYAE